MTGDSKSIVVLVTALAFAACSPATEPAPDAETRSPAAAATPNAGETPPPFDEFREWASDHAIAIDSVGFGTDLTELKWLDTIIGSARVIAVSEPFHGPTSRWLCGTG